MGILHFSLSRQVALMSETLPLDWEAVYGESRSGNLFVHLTERVPRTYWRERGKNGATLLHYACQGDNAVAAAALLTHGLSVNARDAAYRTPSHLASFNGQHRVLKLMCAAGADLQLRDFSEEQPLDMALSNPTSEPGADKCVRVLLANGVRLETSRQDLWKYHRPWMVALENGRTCCRTLIVTLLGLKRRRGDVLRELDRFVVLEIAVCIWATRADKDWQREN